MNANNTLSSLLRMRMTSAGPTGIGVTIAGELDVATAGLLRAWIIDTVHHLRPASITLDLSRLQFIDVAGVRMLYELHESASADGCALTVGAAPPMFWWILSRMGLDPDFAGPPLIRP